MASLSGAGRAQIAARRRRDVQKYDRHQQQLQIQKTESPKPKPKQPQPQCQTVDQEQVDILENPHCVGGMSARWAAMAHGYLRQDGDLLPRRRPSSAGSPSRVAGSSAPRSVSGSGGQVAGVIRLQQQPPKPPSLPGPGSGKSGSGSGAATAAAAATELSRRNFNPDPGSDTWTRTPPSFSSPPWHRQTGTDERAGDRRDPVRVFKELKINEMVDESAFQAGSRSSLSLTLRQSIARAAASDTSNDTPLFKHRTAARRPCASRPATMTRATIVPSQWRPGLSGTSRLTGSSIYNTISYNM